MKHASTAKRILGDAALAAGNAVTTLVTNVTGKGISSLLEALKIQIL